MRIFDGKWKEEFFKGEIIRWHDSNDPENDDPKWLPKRPRITIEKIVAIPCPVGRGFHNVFFPENKAFLCLVEDLPFKKEGKTEFINKFCLIGNPKVEFLNWCGCQLEDDGDGWGESEIFSSTREEAVAAKVNTIENMAQQETLCRYCGKQSTCKESILSLIQESKAENFSVCMQ